MSVVAIDRDESRSAARYGREDVDGPSLADAADQPAIRLGPRCPGARTLPDGSLDRCVLVAGHLPRPHVAESTDPWAVAS